MTVKVPIHLSATLTNGVKIIVICKTKASPEDLVTSTIEGVTCYKCLETYQHYLNLLDADVDLKEIENTEH